MIYINVLYFILTGVHEGSVPIVPISAHKFRGTSQELRKAQMAVHKRPFYNSGNVRVLNNKQDVKCYEDTFEDKHKHIPGYVRHREILKEVESHKERRLKKLKKLQEKLGSNASSKTSLFEVQQNTDVKSRRSVNGASKIIKIP